MTVQPRSRQRGISFIGLLFVGVVLAVVGVIAAQVFPTFIEYQAVAKAVNKASGGNSVAEVRTIFDKDDFTRQNVIAAEVENVIDALTGQAFSRAELSRDVVEQRQFDLRGDTCGGKTRVAGAAKHLVERRARVRGPSNTAKRAALRSFA